LILPDSFLKLIFGNEILPFLWIVPITVFFNTINLLLYTWFLRKEYFKLLSKNKIILSVFGIFLQIGIGFLYLGTRGFIIANLLSILISLSLLFYFFNKSSVSKEHTIRIGLIKEIAYEYRKFPLVSVWGNVLNIFTLQLPQIFLNKVFGSQILGHYSLAQNMISFPLGFTSSAIQDIFRQSASKEEVEKKSFMSSYLSALKISTILGALLLLACLTFIPSLFVVVFGDKWLPSGIYVKVLALLFVIRFIVAPLSYSFYIKSKQQIDFLWQLGLLILSILSLYGAYFFLKVKNPSSLLFVYSIVLSIWYLFNLSLTYKLAKGADN
jgi:O-antigen/teichoic acid export membrane protein